MVKLFKSLFRRIILNDEVYNVIKAGHVNLGHQGRDMLLKEIESDYFHISHREITWFIDNCYGAYVNPPPGWIYNTRNQDISCDKPKTHMRYGR